MRAALLLLFASASGCIGARVNVRADELEYPVSMSHWLVKDGVTVSNRQIDKIGKVKHSERAWSLLYSRKMLTGEVDISRAVNEQTKALNGDAVVNLGIVASGCWVNALIGITVVLPMLPVLPGCVDIDIEGDVVTIRRSTVP